jgi:hypothetical protein
MAISEEILEWINRNRRRKAVFEALGAPQIGREILRSIRHEIPGMTYFDLRHTLRELQERGVVWCLNPEEQTGRVYRRASDTQSPLANEQIETAIDWKVFGQIARGRARTAVLCEVAAERWGDTLPKTANHIRRNLLKTYPLSLTKVISALRFLESGKLIHCTARTRIRSLKVYAITEIGSHIVGQLPRQTQPEARR